jgi:hypothetical protein
VIGAVTIIGSFWAQRRQLRLKVLEKCRQIAVIERVLMPVSARETKSFQKALLTARLTIEGSETPIVDYRFDLPLNGLAS